MKKILVTGGAGFIGSHITDLLLKKDYSVVIVDSLISGNRKNLNPEAELHKVDIRTNKLGEVFEKVKPEAVIHQAAQINVKDSIKKPINDAQHNIIGSINVIKNAIKTKVKKIIFASSGGAIYGDPKKIPTDENVLPQPLSPYAVAKESVEHYLSTYSKINNFDYTILRYSNVFGPRQDPKGEAGVISIFISLLLKKEQPHINGDGQQTRDFVYVKDVARANLKALEKKTKNNIFNIGTGKKTSINDLYKQIKETIGSKIEAKHQKASPGEVRHSALDVTRAKNELAWQPRVNLKAGLKTTVDWQKK